MALRPLTSLHLKLQLLLPIPTQHLLARLWRSRSRASTMRLSQLRPMATKQSVLLRLKPMPDLSSH